jgi:hypothetical protein
LMGRTGFPTRHTHQSTIDKALDRERCKPFGSFFEF